MEFQAFHVGRNHPHAVTRQQPAIEANTTMALLLYPLQLPLGPSHLTLSSYSLCFYPPLWPLTPLLL